MEWKEPLKEADLSTPIQGLLGEREVTLALTNRGPNRNPTGSNPINRDPGGREIEIVTNLVGGNEGREGGEGRNLSISRLSHFHNGVLLNRRD